MAGLNWQSARVVSSHGGRAVLRFMKPEACRRCARGEGCGAGVFSGLFPFRSGSVEVGVDFDAKPGDWVRVGIGSRTLALGALGAYGVPLAAFVAGALPAHLMLDAPGWRDAGALIGGLLAAVIGLRAAGRLVRPPVNLTVERLSCSGDDTNSTGM